MKINPVSSTPHIPLPPRPRQVMINGLKVGQTLISDAKSPDGKVIATAGTQLTSAVLNKLKSSEASNGLDEPILTE